MARRDSTPDNLRLLTKNSVGDYSEREGGFSIEIDGVNL